MRRVAILLVSVLILTLPAISSAQSLFNLPGMPSLGNWGRSAAGGCGGCEEPVKGLCAPAFYAGYMADRQGTTFAARSDAAPLFVVQGLQHHYTLQGLWLGASQTCQITPSVGLIATGWYLFPANKTSDQTYDTGLGTLKREWDTDTNWWYADAVLAFGTPGGLTFLGGARYDHFSTKFKNPTIGTFIGGFNDQADVESHGIIPLLGTQYALNSANQSLVVRAVGIPTLVGPVKYNESIGGFTAVEATGNWRGGHFLEIFSEYAAKMGAGEFGVFGRWNMAHGRATLNTTLTGIAAQDLELNLDRFSWTLGGKVGFNF